MSPRACTSATKRRSRPLAPCRRVAPTAPRAVRDSEKLPEDVGDGPADDPEAAPAPAITIVKYEPLPDVDKDEGADRQNAEQGESPAAGRRFTNRPADAWPGCIELFRLWQLRQAETPGVTPLTSRTSAKDAWWYRFTGWLN